MPREDLQDCRAALRSGSTSFYAASLLLPRRVRDPATILYAFCREADDLVDLGTDAGAALRALHGRLDAVYAGRPEPADAGLAEVAARFAIPRPLFDALLEGFAWDAQGRDYDSLAALEAYAARVAGVVGEMMALLMGVRAADTLARARELGLAMQYTNIARDVGEDARAGRLYLPREWLAEAGLDAEAWRQAPVYDARLAAVVRRLLAVADGHYRRADAAIARLPRDCRPGIRAARLIYAEIGRAVERRNGDSVGARARVASARKAVLMLRALMPLPAAPAAAMRGRLLFVIALFERLERSDIARGDAAWARAPTR